MIDFTKVQNDICYAVAIETLSIILKNIRDSYFFILIDESRNVVIKEQMVIALKYVDRKFCVIEHFIGIRYITFTMAII